MKTTKTMKTKKMISLFVAVCLVVTVIVLPSFAVSDSRSGALSGCPTTANASIQQSTAGASTSISGTQGNGKPHPTVSVTATYYYIDAYSTGTTLEQSQTKTANNTNTTTFASVSFSPGSVYTSIRIVSTHTVKYDGQTWNASLSVRY